MKRALTFHFVATNSTSNMGGSELLWSRAAAQLAELGHRIIISTPSFPGKEPALYDQIRARNGRICFYETARHSLTSKLRHYFLKLFLGPETDFRSLSRNKADLVVISQGGATDGLVWAEYCASADLSFVTIAQAVRIREWLSDEVAERVLPAFSRAQTCYFVSQRNMQLFASQLGEPLANARTIPQEFQGTKHSMSWPEGSLRLACVARIEPPDKGHDLFLDVFSRKPWNERDLTVTFFGSGASARTFRKEVQRRGLDRRLRFAGHADDISKIWAAHHGLILPSREEGQSLAVLEAMNCSRMVISSNVGDNSLLIEDGKTGFLMEVASPSELERALERAWNARDRWKAMGEQAKQRLSALYPELGSEVLVRELLSLTGESMHRESHEKAVA